MGTVATSRARRVRVDESYVDVEFPFGATLHLPLIDVSGSGVGFQLPECVEALSPGARLDCVLALSGREIPGRLEIARNRPREGGSLCGARFRARQRYSAVFRELIARLERGELRLVTAH